jgi:hypothetical protein
VALCRVSSLDNLLVTHILHSALARAHAAWSPLLSCLSQLPLTSLLRQTDLYCGPLLDQLPLPQMTQAGLCGGRRCQIWWRWEEASPWPFWLVPYWFPLCSSPIPLAHCLCLGVGDALFSVGALSPRRCLKNTAYVKFVDSKCVLDCLAWIESMWVM